MVDLPESPVPNSRSYHRSAHVLKTGLETRILSSDRATPSSPAGGIRTRSGDHVLTLPLLYIVPPAGSVCYRRAVSKHNRPFPYIKARDQMILQEDVCYICKRQYRRRILLQQPREAGILKGGFVCGCGVKMPGIGEKNQKEINR